MVCTPCEGVEEYAQAGVNCLQVPADNSKELAGAVQRLLGDRDLAEALGQAGRATAQRFTWDSVADRTEQAMLASLENLPPRGGAVGAR